MIPRRRITPDGVLIAVSVLIIIITLILSNACHGPQPPAPQHLDSIEDLAYYPADTTPEPDIYDIEEAILDCMCAAFAEVESGNDPDATNLRENAIGILQIRPVMVREANAIVGEELYHHYQCYDPETSCAIFRTVMRRHNPGLDIDAAIDIWNPRCSRSYRDRVKNLFHDISQQSTL